MNKKLKKIAVITSLLSLPLLLNSQNTNNVKASSLVNNNTENKISYETNMRYNVIADGTGSEYKYRKTVIKYYKSLNTIPLNIYYEEFNDNYQVWMKGSLRRTAVTQLDENKYKVVFSGMLS